MSRLEPNSVVPIPPRKRMDYIDALRGGACLWVVLHHLLGSYVVQPGWKHWPLWLVVKVATVGWLGVNLFLVLSGFCLYYPLVRRVGPSQVSLNLKQFAKRRAWRILPPYYATMLVFYALALRYSFFAKVPLKAEYQGWGNFFSHLVMLHNLSPTTIFTINGVFWSLALESQLYVVFPFLVWLAAKRGFPTVLISTLCCSLVWEFAVFAHFGLPVGWSEQFAVWYHALPGRCFEFAAGMATAALVVSPPSRITRSAVTVAAAFTLPALYYALFVSRAGPFLDPMWGVVFCGLILVLHQLPHHLFQKNFVLRGLTWAGTISYSLYLTHNLVLQRISLPQHNDILVLLKAVLTVVVCIVVAYVFFWCFERPFLVRRNASEAEVVQATALSPAP